MHTMRCTVGDTAILSDGCPACEEIAACPVRLADRRVLSTLIAMATDRGVQPRTENEAKAVANVLTTLERFGRIAEVEPELAIAYLGEKWRIPVSA
jgi:hypothetical protein